MRGTVDPRPAQHLRPRGIPHQHHGTRLAGCADTRVVLGLLDGQHRVAVALERLGQQRTGRAEAADYHVAVHAPDPQGVEAIELDEIGGDGGGEHAKRTDAGEHQQGADQTAGNGDREDVAVADGGDSDDRPPEGVAVAVEVLVGADFGRVEAGCARQNDECNDPQHIDNV